MIYAGIAENTVIHFIRRGMALRAAPRNGVQRPNLTASLNTLANMLGDLGERVAALARRARG